MSVASFAMRWLTQAGTGAARLLSDAAFAVWGRQAATIEVAGIRLCTSGMSRGMRHVLWQGWYEESERAYLARLPSAAQVLELGAAVGFLGLYARRHAGITAWCHVEPSSESIALLRENYRRNGVPDREVVVHAALSGTPGTLHLACSADFWAHRTQEDGIGEAVDGVTLEGLMQRCPFVPDTLVIDVEGAELVFLEQPIPASVRRVIVEIHPHLVGHDAIHELIGVWRRQGFRVQDERQHVLFLERP